MKWWLRLRRWWRGRDDSVACSRCGRPEQHESHFYTREEIPDNAYGYETTVWHCPGVDL